MSRVPRGVVNGSALLVAVIVLATAVAMCAESRPCRNVSAKAEPIVLTADSVRTGSTATEKDSPKKRKDKKKKEKKQREQPERSPLDEVL